MWSRCPPTRTENPALHRPDTTQGLRDIETYRVFYGEAVEDIRAFLAGEPVRVIS